MGMTEPTEKPWSREARRREDMSLDGELSVFREQDGDMIIAIISNHDSNGYMKEVQFCTHQGGGRSPNVHKALVTLMEAIEKDNQENPL